MADFSDHAAVTDESFGLTPFAHLVGGPFIMPFQDHGALKPFRPQAWKEGQPDLDPTAFSTWLVEGEIFYTLFCIPDPVGNKNETVMVLYDHDTDSLHYLRRDLWITDCPCNTILLAHFIWDTVGNEPPRPNCLIFDVVQWGGERMVGREPRERYENLRKIRLGDDSIISLQFVGERQAVKQFVRDAKDGRVALPHTVKRCITMTKDPFHPIYVPDQ